METFMYFISAKDVLWGEGWGEEGENILRKIL